MMQFPAHVERFEELAGLTGQLHLAIGVFDGVHLGHKAVIESAVFSAQRSGGVSGVLAPPLDLLLMYKLASVRHGTVFAQHGHSCRAADSASALASEHEKV